MTASFSPTDFYASHRVQAVAWATVLTGRRDIGEEIAQEALLATIGHLPALREPVAYLRTVVVNTCRSWRRAADRESRRMELVAADDPCALSPPTVEMFDLLDGLPYRHRAALLLRFWAGWTDAEIAGALDCRVASVRVFVHRGLAALRKQLSEEESR